MLSYERKSEISKRIQSAANEKHNPFAFNCIKLEVIKEFTENGYTREDAESFISYAASVRVF